MGVSSRRRKQQWSKHQATHVTLLLRGKLKPLLLTPDKKSPETPCKLYLRNELTIYVYYPRYKHTVI
jgi:hypothetical protein